MFDAAQYAAVPHDMVTRVMRSYFTRLPDDAARIDALRQLLPISSPAAVRGFLQSTTERAADPVNLSAAEGMLTEIERGLIARSAGKEFARILIELANERGRVLRRLQRFRESVAELQKAVDQARALADPQLLGICTTNLCRALLDGAEAGEPLDRAVVIDMLEENIERLGAIGDKRNLAVAWNNLGDALAPVDAARAEECLRKDVQLAEELNEIDSLVGALDRLGVHLADRRRPAEAIEVHERERKLFEKLFDFEREAQCLANLGRAYFSLAIQERRESDLALAIKNLDDSRNRYGNLNRPRPLAAVLENLGKARWLQGESNEALKCLQESIAEYRRWPGGDSDAQRLQSEIDSVGSV